MRRVPSVLAATSAFLLLSALPARAATCPMVTDPTGDAQLQTIQGHPIVQSPVWDIVSADVATGPTTLVAVIRLADLRTGTSYPDTNSFFFRATQWLVGWDIGTTHHMVALRISFGAVNSEYTYDDGPTTVTTPVPVTVDQAGGTISWTVPRSAVPGLTGATMTTVSAKTMYMSSSTDTAQSTTSTFTDGTAGCVSAA